jgi:hypothetical protein
VTGGHEKRDAELYKFAEDMSKALEEGILATQKTWRIPFTGVTIGWHRMDLEASDHTTHVIEIRIWWRGR